MKASLLASALVAMSLSSPVALANPVSDASISMIGISDRDAWTYLLGAANALVIADAMQLRGGGPRMFCLPNRASATPEEIIRQAEKDLVGPHHPETVVMVAVLNLEAEYPC